MKSIKLGKAERDGRAKMLIAVTIVAVTIFVIALLALSV